MNKTGMASDMEFPLKGSQMLSIKELYDYLSKVVISDKSSIRIKDCRITENLEVTDIHLFSLNLSKQGSCHITKKKPLLPNHSFE